MGLVLVLAMSFMAVSAGAQVAPPAPDTNIENIGDVYDLINTIFNMLFWLLIVLASVFIIWAAFNYLTAGGDPEKIQKANQKVIYAAVAVVIAVLARAIPSIVCSFLSNSGCATPYGQ